MILEMKTSSNSNQPVYDLPPLLVSRSNAQKLLGVSRATFYRRIILEGVRPVLFRGGRPMFRMNDIKRLAGEKP